MITSQQWLQELFPGLHDGYFVEAGAHDGIGDSQTKWLEDLGWTGICVEPSGAYVSLIQDRKCRTDNRCLWSRDGEQVPFAEVHGTELSGIVTCFGDHWDRSANTTTLKPTVSLTTLLREHEAPPVIHYLSLDTEGSEFEILQAHDFARYRFMAISVEHNGVRSRQLAMRELLAARNYAVDTRESGVDDLFVWQDPASWARLQSRLPE